ncbi:hypothetical protein HK102_010737, partial [Quaeritorhiza haematococci]
LWSDRLPYALFHLAAPIADGAAVTLDAPAGWVSTTAGVADLMESIPVEMPAARTILPPFVAGPKTMTNGYNVQQAHNYSPDIIYRKVGYHSSSAAWTTGFGPNIYTVAENGELTSNAQTVSMILYRNNTNNGLDGKGYPTPPGVWTLRWDGHHPNVRLTQTAGGGGSITQLTSTFTGAADNEKTFRVSLNPAVSYYFGVSLTIDGAQSGGVSNVRVYPPGEAEGTSRFNSVFLSRLRGMKSIRFMDMIATNSCNIVHFADWTPITQIRPTRNPEQSGIVADVVQIDPYTNPIPVVGAPPAAGAQGELTALFVAAAYFRDQEPDRKRTQVLIPDSAHGTNPASAHLAGFETVTVKSDSRGLVDIEDFKSKLSDDVAVFMITNPNTVGLFDPQIGEIAELLHERGALLYLDGANMNAILGVVRPGDMGVDLMHYNPHKTFSGPHGGGGPGAGPIAVRAKLAPYLPSPMVGRRDDGTCFLDEDRPLSIGRVRAFFGNTGVLFRAYCYIRSQGPDGLKRVAQHAVLNANYLLSLVRDVYPVP